MSNTNYRTILNGLPAQANRVCSLAEEPAILVNACGGSPGKRDLDELCQLTQLLHEKTRQLSGFFEVEQHHARTEQGDDREPSVWVTASQAPAPGREIDREVWWKEPPKAGEGPDAVDWGYLVTYDNAVVLFLDETPTPGEIENRVGCR